MKGYAEEKRAQDLARRLTGPAFDVYMRLPDEDAEKIGEELQKGCKREQQNREESLHELCTECDSPTKRP